MPPVGRRAHLQHVTQFERGRIIARQEQSLIMWDEMWPLCYGVVVPDLKTNVTETFIVLS
jgi:hypothetical protein